MEIQPATKAIEAKKLSAKERQAAIDNIPEVDIAKMQAKIKKPIKTDPEDVLEAEFLIKFGFTAYWALHPEKDEKLGINLKEMIRLLIASRKIEAGEMYKDAQTAFIGAVSAQSKRPSNAFNKATKKLAREAEVK